MFLVKPPANTQTLISLTKSFSYYKQHLIKGWEPVSFFTNWESRYYFIRIVRASYEENLRSNLYYNKTME
jgi:hypothetical protein